MSHLAGVKIRCGCTPISFSSLNFITEMNNCDLSLSLGNLMLDLLFIIIVLILNYEEIHLQTMVISQQQKNTEK